MAPMQEIRPLQEKFQFSFLCFMIITILKIHHDFSLCQFYSQALSPTTSCSTFFDPQNQNLPLNFKRKLFNNGCHNQRSSELPPFVRVFKDGSVERLLGPCVPPSLDSKSEVSSKDITISQTQMSLLGFSPQNSHKPIKNTPS